MPNHVNNNWNTASKHVVKPECCIPLLELFCPDFACSVSKTCLAIMVNHLEMFSSIFGARFVLKLIQNFASKVISQKLGFGVKHWLWFYNSKYRKNLALVITAKL